MAEPHATDDTGVARAAIAISQRLYDHLAETTQVIEDLVAKESPDLTGDSSLLQLLHETVAANVDTYFSAIRHNIPVADIAAPAVALEHARRLAQRGIPVNALVRGYRLGHSVALQLVLQEIRSADLDPDLRLDVLSEMSTLMFGYIDEMSQQVSAIYQAERERWLESRNAVRALRVREILANESLDVDAMTAAIHYPLRRTHVALVVWYPESGGDRLAAAEGFTKQVTESVAGQGAPLFIPADSTTGWAWIPLASNAGADAVAQIRSCAQTARGEPWVAIGEPLPGVEGFRRSHQQALAVHRLAVASGTARVSAASDPGLSAAALLGGDNVAAARAWVGEVLGPLACATDGDERLRDTLRVFLRAGSSFKAAGEQLHFHVNTMKYRVQRAIERRGRPIAEDRLDVEIALLLCQWFGAAVLSSEDE
ncbi:ABC transporter substrate-binding protein [Mycolicibacter terrae]|uniref:ABC transporter substrate-binding protein n=1 Tax=Mycolicibacter terrae TaxID=1788 RepID=A0AAD1HSM0_9MYCO|nr:helix-turn-helix domain-containing protein [Mycolicibacter terrae]ORW95037.1 PucR family transcriptional regulator [Mycolicibacter terrae]BBX20693.1 ABC transporter substrate-binding protein [Mycolicibacter terrae]SNV94263.1 Regulator of polyketide synthase expression [Mycolicibacter terrae]